MLQCGMPEVPSYLGCYISTAVAAAQLFLPVCYLRPSIFLAPVAALCSHPVFCICSVDFGVAGVQVAVVVW